MRPRPALTDEVREQAVAYVEAVVARARGARATADGELQAAEMTTGGKPLLARLVPGFVKRGVVRMLIYALRHPFDHLAQPLQIRLEEEIGQSRGIAQAALTRAEEMGVELRRLRAELDRERRGR
jgi:hypothetical protein